MTTKVHILATCLSEALLDATLLVFRTLRVGFPNAEIVVWANGLRPNVANAVLSASTKTGCQLMHIPETAHDLWVAALLGDSLYPFWIVDTDIVFWSSVEGFASGFLLGRYEPTFLEPWTGTQHVERLHTSLLYFDPAPIRQAIRSWMASYHPKGFPFLPDVQLVRQHYVPQRDKPALFYDTCAALFNAIGGTPFTLEQDSAFEHLHCGVYSNRINEALPGITDVHKAVFADLNAARGLREQQSTFYQDHALRS